ncbi:MAG: hypothetical protein ABID38_01530 [Candidatus Diapherotrites archaeon]
MTTKNSILLIIKQNPGIEYSSLLNKVAANYSTINSARAALSRALKDLIAFGFVFKRESHLFATEKATTTINLEMKNKLLMRLNNAVKSRNSLGEVDTIVESLHNLIERSKEDTDLLKAARGSTDFYVSDIENLEKGIEGRREHLAYISKILGEQVKSLKNLDFNDIIEKELKQTPQLIQKIVSNENLRDISVESADEEFLELISKNFDSKKRGRTVSIQAKKLKEFLKLFSSEAVKKNILRVNIYLSDRRVLLTPTKAYFIGPYSKLHKKSS